MIDLPDGKIWLPPKPAIIRPAEHWMTTAARVGRMFTEPQVAILPGMTGAVAAVAKRKDIAFVNASTQPGEGSTMSMPADVQVGDMIIVLHSRDGAVTDEPSSGYTEITGSGDGLPSFNISYKFMVGSVDADIPRPSFVDNVTASSVAAAFRKVDSSSPFSATATEASGASGMPDPPSITPGVARSMVVAFAAHDDDVVTMTPPTGMTLAANENGTFGDGSNAASAIAYLLRENTSAFDPGAFGGGESDDWHSVTIALRRA